VQVVNLADAAFAGHRLADRVGHELWRGALQEHSPTGFEEAVGGVEHDRDQRGDVRQRGEPVVRMTAPAMAVKMNATRSARMCWKEPSMFIDWRLALDSV